MAPRTPLSRVRATSWMIVFELALTLRKHWRLLEPGERRRLAELLKRSQGKPMRLTATERGEVRKLVAKLEPGAIARSVVPIGRRAAKARRR